ncbi:MAG: glucosamine-6-phosphate deaminase [Verrucomicrobiales bacterium]|jgi:glucosamine-6-phosphate deaminase|nr:glucosamine-6-phosphate deaminase [Verrucomicrobiales bacterium]|tara:strand:- start:9605 stop:10336 length:732 start_codon:yes stop_codon:yes gene_type:complete
MKVSVFSSKSEMGAAAADFGAGRLREVLDSDESASIIVATGASQFEMLESLRKKNLSWPRIKGFHLDEYIGLPISHDASFRKYLWQRFVSQLDLPLQEFHFLNGEEEAQQECRRVGDLIAETVIDVAFVGIGENGHLAFNDPPADFVTTDPYLVVDLDDACRRQQLGEGWFPDFDSVPRQAISMSVQQIMKSRTIVCTVPDERKAEAVKSALQGEVSPDVPASILQTHSDCHLFLDNGAASLL